MMTRQDVKCFAGRHAGPCDTRAACAEVSYIFAEFSLCGHVNCFVNGLSKLNNVERNEKAGKYGKE